MPFWRIYTPVGAYTDQDKDDLAKAITALYAAEMPSFYCDVFFFEVPGNDAFRGGESGQKFVRIQVEHIARSMNTKVMREFIMNLLTETIRPWLDGRGYTWEMSIEEMPRDLWTVDGFTPPPWRSPAEMRWRQENKSSPYDWSETVGFNEDGSIMGLEGGVSQ
jgi:phenylpyruvate tautomerase PptA (4-oxalocrotonate tautomerase family)